MKILVWIGIGFLLATRQSPAASSPVIIAHRGASGYLPEHTLASKAAAHAMGADYLEQDLVLSKDNVPVVLHDIYLDTVTDVARCFPGRSRPDGRFYALDFSLAELQRLQVTERFDPKTGKAVYPGRFPLWQSVFRISTFEEELQFLRGMNKSTGRNSGIYPEIKKPAWHRGQGRDISKTVLEILARHGYRTKSDNFYLQCFEYDEVRRIRGELGFQGRLVQLIEETRGSASADGSNFLTSRQGLEELAGVVDGIGPALSHVLAATKDNTFRLSDLVKNAHELKLVVHPYTVRADALPKHVKSAEDLFRALFLQAGVDGVFTDHPDLGVALVKSLKAGQ